MEEKEIQKNQDKNQNENQKDASVSIKEVAEILSGNKGEDILMLDLTEIHSYLSYFLIATALSKTHLRKLTSDVIHYFKVHHRYLPAVPHDKEFESGWVALDGGTFMVHIFLADKREFYALEKLWKDAKEIL